MDFERDQSVLGRFPNSKTLLSFFARARKHFSLLLGSPRSRGRHPALLRLFRSM